MGLAMHTYDASYAPQRTARHHFMMYTSRAQKAFEHQQFFFQARSKLATLLNTVGQEAKAAPFPISMDYPELTNAITQLLEEAQVASGLTYDQIQKAGLEMGAFGEKVQLVETLAANLRERAVTATPKPISRKRVQARDEEEEDIQCSFSKRGRNAAADYDMFIEPNFCGPYADRFLQTAWWTQQVCD